MDRSSRRKISRRVHAAYKLEVNAPVGEGVPGPPPDAYDQGAGDQLHITINPRALAEADAGRGVKKSGGSGPVHGIQIRSG